MPLFLPCFTTFVDDSEHSKSMTLNTTGCQKLFQQSSPMLQNLTVYLDITFQNIRDLRQHQFVMEGTS